MDKLTWSQSKAENVGEDAGHAQVRHPGYIVLFACVEGSKIYTVSNSQARSLLTYDTHIIITLIDFRYLEN